MSEHALVIGEALIDEVKRPDGTAASHPGGSPANVALGLGRLGREVELLAWLADDARGQTVRAHLEGSGVTLAEGSLLAPSTSVATAHLDDTGAATYDFDLEWNVSPQAKPKEGPVVVHTGSIAAVIAPGGSEVLSMVRALRDTSTVTYDPNARPVLMGEPAQARRIIEATVEVSDVVKVSDEDLEWLGGEGSADAMAEDWAQRGPSLVVMTRGGSGATAFLRDGRTLDVQAPRVEVADTVGAGDSFMGGLIDGLWSAGLLGAANRDALAAIDDATVTQILTRCAKIAAITVSRVGANPPGSVELGE